MTEAEWITSRMPLYMLREFPAAWSERKARLFWCACLRRAWTQLTDDRTRHLVAEVENWPEADAAWFVREHSFAFEAINRSGSGIYQDYWVFTTFLNTPPGSLSSLVGILADRAVEEAPWASGFDPWSAVWSKLRDDAEAREKAWQCDLIREVFGNPFRPVDVGPWLTSDVVALARGIYEEKAFDRMPILADALQDPGCDDVNVLDHCREPGEHVRGCWLIDRLLEKG